MLIIAILVMVIQLKIIVLIMKILKLYNNQYYYRKNQANKRNKIQSQSNNHQK